MVETLIWTMVAALISMLRQLGDLLLGHPISGAAAASDPESRNTLQELDGIQQVVFEPYTA